ncbi:hypothetical protein V2G26_003408 [Clonostachys chloroleuca]
MFGLLFSGLFFLLNEMPGGFVYKRTLRPSTRSINQPGSIHHASGFSASTTIDSNHLHFHVPNATKYLVN